MEPRRILLNTVIPGWSCSGITADCGRQNTPNCETRSVRCSSVGKRAIRSTRSQYVIAVLMRIYYRECGAISKVQICHFSSGRAQVRDGCVKANILQRQAICMCNKCKWSVSAWLEFCTCCMQNFFLNSVPRFWPVAREDISGKENKTKKSLSDSHAERS
jgi:hypothetical protein